MRDYLAKPQNYCVGERAIFRAPNLSLPLAANGAFSLVLGGSGAMENREQGVNSWFISNFLTPFALFSLFTVAGVCVRVGA